MKTKKSKLKPITFIGSPAKHGDYYIFQIPNKLIKNKLIDPDVTYQILLEPVQSTSIFKSKETTVKEEGQ